MTLERLYHAQVSNQTLSLWVPRIPSGAFTWSFLPTSQGANDASWPCPFYMSPSFALSNFFVLADATAAI